MKRVDEKTPLVTVYIPTLDRRDLLERAMTSVLEQDYKNTEVIVAVDGWQDETISYLEKIRSKRTNVNFFVNPSSMGACYSRNKAVQIASGEFVTGLDDDDYFLPHRISSFVDLWKKRKEGVVGLFSDSIIRTKSERRTKRPMMVTSKDLLFNNCVGNQIFIRREDFLKFSGFDETFPIWQDLEFWYRILSESGLSFQKTSDGTYVVDKSHPHERISSHRSKKISNVCSLFIKKYNLSSRDAEILKGHTYFYFPERLENIDVVKVLVRTFSFRAALVVLKIVIRRKAAFLFRNRKVD